MGMAKTRFGAAATCSSREVGPLNLKLPKPKPCALLAIQESFQVVLTSAPAVLTTYVSCNRQPEFEAYPTSVWQSRERRIDIRQGCKPQEGGTGGQEDGGGRREGGREGRKDRQRE